MQAGMMLDAQKARIHVAGKTERSNVEINIECIGRDCAFFIVTTEQGAGACAPALLNPLVQLSNRAEIRDNAFAVAVTESCEEFVVDPRTGSSSNFFSTLGLKLRKLFAMPKDDAPARSNHLKPVE